VKPPAFKADGDAVDSSRKPLAGAAIHCWQNPSLAMAEISRVLKPGGIFVGSTFLDATAPLGQLLGSDEMLQPFKQFDLTRVSSYRWWSEPELRDLFQSVGLQNFQCQRSFRFILWRVTKPELPQIPPAE
jgi:SAM-dependent methyltransferase